MRSPEDNLENPIHALAEVFYDVDSAADAEYQAPHKRGFVTVPTQAELLIICHNGKNTLRHANTLVGFSTNPAESISGKHVIPNLRRQMRTVGDYIASCVQNGGTREFSYTLEEIESERGWFIRFGLQKDSTVVKRYEHQDGHVFEVKLLTNGRLLLPKFPEGRELIFG